MWNLKGHVVVTGSLGRVGKAVCAELSEQGIPWRGIDFKATPIFTDTGEFAHLKYDLREYGQTVEALAGASSVIHAAAIAYPSFQSDQRTFVENVTTAYNVFSAASHLKLGKVIWLSSEEVYGHPFSPAMPEYLPIDNNHPLIIKNSYSLAKSVAEKAADYFAEVGNTAFIGFRSTLVQDDGDYAYYPMLTENPLARIWTLWSYIDSSDLARACRIALSVNCAGSHHLNLAAPDTVIDIPSLDLANRYLSTVPIHWSADSLTYASFCDIRATEDFLGYSPKISWRDRHRIARPADGETNDVRA